MLKKLDRVRTYCKLVNSDMTEIGILYSDGKNAPVDSLKFIKKYSKIIKEDIPAIISNINLILNDLKQNKKEQSETSLLVWDSRLQALLK